MIASAVARQWAAARTEVAIHNLNRPRVWYSALSPAAYFARASSSARKSGAQRLSDLPVTISSAQNDAQTNAPEIFHAPALCNSTARKVTWRLIPLLSIGYAIAYIDRINISFAALQMNRDLHFSATVYGLGAGLFFLSYSACEIPSNLMLHRIGARRWMARILLTWGILAMLMARVRTPLEFYGLRLLLGAAEAGFFPGVLYYLTLWFPAGMRARAISRFYVALPLSTAIMGSVAGALLGMQGKAGLAGWQWLFLIEGLPAILLSGVFLRFLPDRPADAAWLQPQERREIDAALAAETVQAAFSAGNSPLRDARVWLFGLANTVMLAVLYAFTFSAPILFAGLTHWSVRSVGNFISAMGLVGVVAMVGNGWHSDRTGERFWHAAIPGFLQALAFLIAAFAHRAAISVPLLALAFVLFAAIQGPLLMLPTTFLNGRNAAVGLATINMVGMVGGFVGPSLMGVLRDWTGSYELGLALLALPMIVFCVILLALRRMLGGRQASVA